MDFKAVVSPKNSLQENMNELKRFYMQLKPISVGILQETPLTPSTEASLQNKQNSDENLDQKEKEKNFYSQASYQTNNASTNYDEKITGFNSGNTGTTSITSQRAKDQSSEELFHKEGKQTNQDKDAKESKEAKDLKDKKNNKILIQNYSTIKTDNSLDNSKENTKRQNSPSKSQQNPQNSLLNSQLPKNNSSQTQANYMENTSIIKVKKHKLVNTNYIMFSNENCAIERKNTLKSVFHNNFSSMNNNKYNTEQLNNNNINYSMEIINGVNSNNESFTINTRNMNLITESSKNETPFVDKHYKDDEYGNNGNKNSNGFKGSNSNIIFSEVNKTNNRNEINEKSDKYADKYANKYKSKYGKKSTANFSIKEIMNSSNEDEYDNNSNDASLGIGSPLKLDKQSSKIFSFSQIDLENKLMALLAENALSKAIFDYNLDKVQKLIKQFESNNEIVSKLINCEDCRKISPIFLCIYLREGLNISTNRNSKNKAKNDGKRKIIIDIIKLLISYNVRIRVRNEDKRTPIEEAVAYNDKEVVEIIYDRALVNKENKIKFSKEKANVFLRDTPDFYVEMKWEVNVPLLSFLCPNDTCKIWKKGDNIRMDYTFIQMKTLSCIRAPTSFIYNGATGKTFLVNWETKKWFDQFEPLDEEEKALIITDIMEGTRLNSEFKLKNCEFTPSLNWRNKPVFEKISTYQSRKYNVKVSAFFDLHHQQKVEFNDFSNKDNYFDLSKPLDKKVLLMTSNDVTKEKISKNLHIKNDMVKKQIENFGKNKDKNLNAFVWVAEKYPFNFAYMISMVNSLSNANEFIEKLKEFFKDPEFQNILDKDGFPIKIKIPINFMIDVTVTFTKYEFIDKKKDLSQMFIIPPNHKQITRKEAQDLKNNFKKRLKYININL